MGLLIGMILISIGTTTIYYRFKIYDFTGEWEWANAYLGNTMNLIVLIGMILIAAGAAYPFGALDGLSSTRNTAIENTNSSK